MRQIPRHPNYSITEDGRVYSCRYDRWLALCNNAGGYLITSLCSNGKAHTCRIHRLVLETYVGPCPPGMECRHLNGNRTDNRLENLKWGTRSENAQDRVKHGTHHWVKLNTSEREMISAAYNSGLCSSKELAAAYGVTAHCIVQVAKNNQKEEHITMNRDCGNIEQLYTCQACGAVHDAQDLPTITVEEVIVICRRCGNRRLEPVEDQR